MRLQALNVIYHSAVCLPSVRADVLEFLAGQGSLVPGDEPPRERIYPAVGTLALDRLCDVVLAEAHSLRQFGDSVDGSAEPVTQLNRARVSTGQRG
jgi:mannosyl-3-phosphoglycerate synthase